MLETPDALSHFPFPGIRFYGVNGVGVCRPYGPDVLLVVGYGDLSQVDTNGNASQISIHQSLRFPSARYGSVKQFSVLEYLKLWPSRKIL